MLKRGFMEYHADRFEDASLLLVDGDKIVALLPGNIREGVFYSHQGLTYGGFIMNTSTRAQDPLAWFGLLTEYLKGRGVGKLVYKCIPHIYHRAPAEEDLYALFRLNARLSVRNLSTVVPIREQLSSGRLKRAPKRGLKAGLSIRVEGDVSPFWSIIEADRRDRHQTTPVHSFEEINLLHERFPHNVRLFSVCRGEEVLAGGVLFVAHKVVHLQYAAATLEGKEIYATDYLYHELINQYFCDISYFDFGTSNEEGGRFLNVGMTAHKEEFGGRSVVYDTYELEL